ncbi:hypothetical protein [Haloarcula nitratireducens]|uniref:Uncharacterized protein n=1 Tax=Haloarcula nitratireducens TaxID=2487749 RepID=A0AAW4PGW2_9EURY|nr:hypothetical protein [Halomicroarcula nitratireducens]MBX0297255.1 hypothetical protein [Halomicroarcula nitratireducens]
MAEGTPSGAGGIDSDILERIERRLRGSTRFSAVNYRPEYAPNAVEAVFDGGYFPAAIEQASLRIRWYTTDDFNIHYAEQYRDRESWECRWDRHPNSHNTREHFHPPPNATTPGTDMSFGSDWREVLSRVLSELSDRIQSFWK